MQLLATRPAARARAVRARWRPLITVLAVLACALPPALRADDAALRVELSPAGEMFPAIELSQSDLGADATVGNGLLRIHVKGDGRARALRLTVDTQGLREPSVLEATLHERALLRPRLEWDVAALRKLAQARMQTLHVTVERDGLPLIEKRVDVRVHPLDEALYFVRDGDARIDLGSAFAAWVDPHDAVVDELLALAETEAMLDRRASTDRNARLQQARAIWIALERHGMRYSTDGAGISQGPVIYSQRVRLLADSWNERVANCLDGSVLIASALERLGMRTLLVLVPGHAFVGFYTDDDDNHAEFLETTLLGHRRAEGDSAHERRVLAAAAFEAARRAGMQSYRRAAAKLDGRHRPHYAIIDISTARGYGIMPIAAGWRAGLAGATHDPAPSPSARTPLRGTSP